MDTFEKSNNTILKKTVFDHLEKVVDLRLVERKLAEVLPSDRWSSENPFHPMTLWKVLLIRNWYGLSEASVLEEIRDRSSLSRFVGEEIWDKRLSEKVLADFETMLTKEKALNHILDEVDEEIYRRGLGRTRGYAVDPVIVKPGGKIFRLDELELERGDCAGRLASET